MMNRNHPPATYLWATKFTLSGEPLPVWKSVSRSHPALTPPPALRPAHDGGWVGRFRYPVLNVKYQVYDSAAAAAAAACGSDGSSLRQRGRQCGRQCW